MKALRDSSKSWMDWFLAISKVAFVVSALSGSFFVVIYLRSVGVSLPAEDLPAMASLFLWVALLFDLFAVLCVAFVLLPMITSWVPTEFRGRRAFVRKSLLLDSAYYFGLIGLFIWILKASSNIYFLPLDIFPLMFVGIGLSVSIWHTDWVWKLGWSGSTSRGREPHVSRGNIAIQSFISALMGLCWSILVLFLAASFISIRWPISSSYFAAILLIILIFITAALYSLFTSSSREIRIFVLSLVACVAVVFAILWSPSVGAMTLRSLGVGGGILISIPPVNGSDKSRSESGCLILNFGSRVFVLPAEQKTLAPCSAVQAPFSATSLTESGKLLPVEILPATRLLHSGPLGTH